MNVYISSLDKAVTILVVVCVPFAPLLIGAIFLRKPHPFILTFVSIITLGCITETHLACHLYSCNTPAFQSMANCCPWLSSLNLLTPLEQTLPPLMAFCLITQQNPFHQRKSLLLTTAYYLGLICHYSTHSLMATQGAITPKAMPIL